MSKVYIAAPWDHRELAVYLAEKLEGKGHEITQKWWLDTDPSPEGSLRQAQADFQGVLSADVMILLNTQARGSETSGKAVETGIALMNCIPIIAVGKPSNVFHYLPDFQWVDTTEAAIKLV